MARMYPAELPESIRGDPKRAAEVQVYESLRESLSGEYHAFYSFCWVSKLRDGRALDGEADFIVAHPDRGILLMEVKGGRVAYDGAKGRWTSTDRDGVCHEIDPLNQLRRAKFALIDKLKSLPAWGNRWVEIGHSVALPHCTAPGGPLTGDLPRDILVCGEDLDRLGQKIESIYRFWGAHAQVKPIGHDGVRILGDLIAPCFELRMSLGAALREEDRRIVRLTEEQFNLLEMLRWNPRVAVSGGAGTGKTLLALEKAKRLAKEGRRTLLVCFNRPLAEFLRASAGSAEGLTVQSFHQLCGTLASRAGVSLGEPDSEALARRFEEELPMAMIDAIAENPDEQFDAIVVDEGQDFLPPWWHALEWAHREGDSGVLYVFFDDNQRIYRQRLCLPKGLIPAVLTRNLRNTRPIFECGRPFYKGTDLIAGGPEGRDLEFAEAGDGQARVKAVSRALHRLIREEGVPPGDVAVLSGKRLSGSCFANADRIGAFSVATAAFNDRSRVLLETVQRFKGLERPVIILTEIDGLAENDEVLYVGVTRARLHLIVVAKADTLNLLRPGADPSGH